MKYPKTTKISAVIAAYNEEPRIARVLNAVVNHPLIDEVIVVNDGSKDKTSQVAKKFNIKLIENEKNVGKTLSIKRGLENAKNDLVLLLDADLDGLDQQALSSLIEPVIRGDLDWTLGLCNNAMGYMKLMKIDCVSGQRVVPKKLLSDPLIWSRPEIGFSLETLMNQSLLSKKTSFHAVYLPNVSAINKAKKIGMVKGWIKEFKMVRQIAKIMPLYKIGLQFIKMARISHKNSKLSANHQN